MTGTKRQTQTREELFTQLYLEAFPATASLISKSGGSLDQASDVFQEALVCYYEQIIIGQKVITGTPKAYVLGTARNLWYQQLRSISIHELLDDHSELPENQPAQISSKRIFQFLEMAGQKCMDLLRAFYYEQQPLDSLAKEFDFGSTRSATVQKYKCLEKVRNEVKERQLDYADFTD